MAGQGGLFYSVVISWAYVVLLHVWRDPPGTRNANGVIVRRTISCLGTCALAYVIITHILGQESTGERAERVASGKDFYWLVGLRPSKPLPAALLPLAHVGLLYAGSVPLYLTAGFKKFLFPRTASLLIYARNLAIAPITEEWVFRAVLITLLEFEGMSKFQAALLAPIFFGAAHIHHLTEQLAQGTARRAAFLNTAFQFTYTCLFGWYASYIFVTSRSLLACVLVHTFCNFMGIPPLDLLSSDAYPRKEDKGNAAKFRLYVLISIAGFMRGWFFFLDPARLAVPGGVVPVVVAPPAIVPAYDYAETL